MENWREDALVGRSHEPSDITVELDGLGRQLSELPGGATPSETAGVDAEGERSENGGPVFVDESGRRGKRIRRAGWAIAAICACYAVTLVASLMGGSSGAPFLNIPIPGIAHKAKAPDAHKAHTEDGASHSVRRSGDPAVVPSITDAAGRIIPNPAATGGKTKAKGKGKGGTATAGPAPGATGRTSKTGGTKAPAKTGTKGGGTKGSTTTAGGATGTSGATGTGGAATSGGTTSGSTTAAGTDAGTTGTTNSGATTGDSGTTTGGATTAGDTAGTTTGDTGTTGSTTGGGDTGATGDQNPPEGQTQAGGPLRGASSEGPIGS